MTQLIQAKKGIITEQMKKAAKKEKISAEKLAEKIAEGSVVLPANKNHKKLSPYAIGAGLTTKINVNLGISEDCPNYELEIKKADLAEKLKAHAVMDLSCSGDTRPFRRNLIEHTSLMVGTVPVYDAENLGKELPELTEEDFLGMLKTHAEDGVDFVTLHAGITKNVLAHMKPADRIMPIVSRGGAVIAEWMDITGKENPFFANFDKVLDICLEYDVTLSLGDACRPGAVHDASDSMQISELIVLGELTKKARDAGVQVMIEGPGHMRIDEIAANMLLEKKLCHNAPFYVLGPLVTDVAPGYDHITSAIGGAIAAASGADFLCYVTPAEHVKLPDLSDVKEGIIASRIAAHAADLAKHVPGADNWDKEMSIARSNLDWKKMLELALDPEKPGKMREESMPRDPAVCTMCGKMCSVNRTNRIKEKIK
ncbi:phosphomethylpyrimidine synthase ThiC [Spirochaetia bacterium 38H-sp]|uniref:Phosphomethylpyrimidine synthase n=1 Tax=Rarispira pelagica TaxID=3141764 RepID=A0ABU9UAM4_9SPIR